MNKKDIPPSSSLGRIIKSEPQPEKETLEDRTMSMASGKSSSSSDSKRQSRQTDLSEDQRKELQRQRNISYLRKSREKIKEQDKRDRQIFEENERKIERLEGMVERLESELHHSPKKSTTK